MSFGRFIWAEHPRVSSFPLGHQRKGGEGEVVHWMLDDHGQLSGVVEMPDGSVQCIRMDQLKRRVEKKAGAK
jgi:hypothetical protein